jgi:hypothetical protein
MITANVQKWTLYFVNEYNFGKCLLLSLKAVLLTTYRKFKIKYTSSLPTALYGHGMWLFVLKEHHLQMSENGVQGK